MSYATDEEAVTHAGAVGTPAIESSHGDTTFNAYIYDPRIHDFLHPKTVI